jgi:hypothetical protein
VLAGLEKIRNFFIRKSLLDKLRFNATQQRAEEETKLSLMLHARATSIFNEWRVHGLFLKFEKNRANRSLASPSDREKHALKHMAFSVWKDELESVFRVKLFVLQRERSILKSVLAARSSPWRQSVLESKLARKVDECNAAACLAVWMFALEEKQRTACELLEKFESAQIKKIKLLFLHWKFFVSNRARSKWAILVEWRSFTHSCRRQLAGLVWFIPELEKKRSRSILSLWSARAHQRQKLRHKVGLFSASNEHRLLMASFLGLFAHTETMRKIHYCVEKREKTICAKGIDRWVNATVFAMSLQEVFARVERIRDKVRCDFAFRSLESHGKIEIYLEKKRRGADLLNFGKNNAIISSCMHAWSNAAKKQVCVKVKTAGFFKKRFFAQIKHFSAYQRKQCAADEWALVNESARMTLLIEHILIEWRSFTDYSLEIKMKFSALHALASESRLGFFFSEWRYAVELAMYEWDLEANQQELGRRISEKTKSNIFTFLLILFRESQGLQKFSSEYSHSLLVKKVLLGWTRELDLQRRVQRLESDLKIRRVKGAFKTLFKEVYLSFKERLFRKNQLCREIFSKLRLGVRVRRKKLLVKSMSRWKAEKANHELDACMHLKSVVFASWRVISNETKLLKIYLPQTAASTPTVVPSAVGSYKQFRSLISSQLFLSPCVFSITHSVSVE